MQYKTLGNTGLLVSTLLELQRVTPTLPVSHRRFPSPIKTAR
jgi:hypothetical protein